MKTRPKSMMLGLYGFRQEDDSAEELLQPHYSVPVDRSLEIAEKSYQLAYMANSKSNSFCHHTNKDTMVCVCGEEEKDFAWIWSTKENGGQAGSIVLGPEGRHISFNPEYSSGTAAIRGNQILPCGYHHYWELKMTSPVYGTNTMIGVCTPHCDIAHGIHRFCSLLGRDEESWGYSYTGTTQHGGKFSRYGPRWGKGAIIGVHLDTWRGTLEFFLNRKPLGIAFTGLQNKELYPIVTSTSAHTEMKLVTSAMFAHSLQFLSSEALFKRLPKMSEASPEDLLLPPGLQTHIKQNYWPFIKYVSLRSGDNRLENFGVSNDGLEYVPMHSSKRSQDDDATDVRTSKRLCTHSLFSSREPFTTFTELRSSSPAGTSSGSESCNVSGHRCVCGPSSCDRTYRAKKPCPCCEHSQEVREYSASSLCSNRDDINEPVQHSTLASADKKTNMLVSTCDDPSRSQCDEVGKPQM